MLLFSDIEYVISFSLKNLQFHKMIIITLNIALHRFYYRVHAYEQQKKVYYEPIFR